jgi:hypothetical protein
MAWLGAVLAAGDAAFLSHVSAACNFGAQALQPADADRRPRRRPESAKAGWRARAPNAVAAILAPHDVPIDSDDECRADVHRRLRPAYRAETRALGRRRDATQTPPPTVARARRRSGSFIGPAEDRSDAHAAARTCCRLRPRRKRTRARSRAHARRSRIPNSGPADPRYLRRADVVHRCWMAFVKEEILAIATLAFAQSRAA